MKTRIIIVALLTVLLIIASIALLSSISYENKPSAGMETENKDTGSELLNITHIDNTYVEAELPPEQFIGTIIEETPDYIIVAPNDDEEEFEISKKIKVSFIRKGKDYLFGTGRKVLITYIPHIQIEDGMGHITTDSVETEGFEDFHISVTHAEDDRITLVLNTGSLNSLNPAYDIYYYGLCEVLITVDGKTLPLSDALKMGKITPERLISKCNIDASLNNIRDDTLKDGGTRLYFYDDYTIIKYHTLDGNRDIFIGKPDMSANVSTISKSGICIFTEPDYGLCLSAKDVTDTGLTLVFTKKASNFQTGELNFGDEYTIQKRVESTWQDVPYRKELEGENLVWNCIAYIINEDHPYTEHKVDWSFLYGTLEPGSYRISKEITDFRGTGDYDKFTAYAYFNIPYRCGND